MQIEKVMSLLEVLSSWLEDNINMDSEIIFDKDEEEVFDEILYGHRRASAPISCRLARL